MANTAQRSALSMIADTPEEQAALQKVMASRKALEDALKSRENQLFDPVLLAIAQGMLAPTKTGSFGEALGNAAAMVGPAQAGEEKRAMEIAQIRSELAAQELGMAQTARGEREFRRLLGGQTPGTAPAAPATPGAAPGAPVSPAEGATPAAAPQGGMRSITEQDIARLAAMPGQEGKAKILSDMIRSQRDRFKMSMNGIVFDSDTQQYLNLRIPGQKQEEFATPYGTFKMTPYEYDQYKTAEEAGKGGEWIEKFRRPGGMAAPGAPGAAPGRRTVSESEAASAAAKEEAVAGAKSRGEQTAQVRAAGKAALGLLPIYDRMEVLIKAPGMDQVMGVLERGDVISALGSLVEEAVRVGTFSVGVPAVRKIVAQTGAPQDVIDRAAELGQLLAITQFEQRKGLGSGTSVSNFEQQMVNAMGPNMTDTLRSFGQKLNFMREKAKFESELASALRRSKMQYEDFEDTPEFAKLFGDYQRRVTNIVYPGQKPFKVVR
jgi:hypothetical protein